MKAFILTFSGTGNTQYVVDAVAESIRNKGWDADICPLEQINSEQNLSAFREADIVGIAFPVHAFNPPWLVEKVVRSLPKMGSRKCFVLRTSGSPFINAGSIVRLKKLLKDRNLATLYDVLVPMPSNFMVRYNDSFIKLNLQMARKQADMIATDLVNGVNKRARTNLLVRLVSWLLLVERLGSHLGGRVWKVEKSCTFCGKCVRDCPTQNIKLQDGKLSFGWNCTLCMRCSFGCPVQAFSNKHYGKLMFVKPPYDLKAIEANPEIPAADLNDDSIYGVKDFRQYWKKIGLLN
jgi:NAD-dependent dihydropyrimidine dehydrogenase PreA subunit